MSTYYQKLNFVLNIYDLCILFMASFSIVLGSRKTLYIEIKSYQLCISIER